MSDSGSPGAQRTVAAIEIGCGLLAAGLLIVSAQGADGVGERSALDVAFPYVLAVLVLLLLGGRAVRRLQRLRRLRRPHDPSR